MVEWLLQRSPTVNMETPGFCTPLQASVSFGDRKIASLLLENGADANQRAGPYITALQIASLEGRTTTTELLLRCSADVTAEGGFYRNALGAAVSAARTFNPVICADVDASSGQCRQMSIIGAEMLNNRMITIVMLLTALRNATRC